MAVLNPQEPPNQGASVSISQLFFVELQLYSEKLGAGQGSQERPPSEAQTSQTRSSLRAMQENGDPAACTPGLPLNKHVTMRGWVSGRRAKTERLPQRGTSALGLLKSDLNTGELRTSPTPRNSGF